MELGLRTGFLGGPGFPKRQACKTQDGYVHILLECTARLT